MWSSRPRFWWQTRTSGNGPSPFGFAWYAMIVAPSPGKVMSAMSMDGSLAGTDSGLRATAGEGEGEAAAAGEGEATAAEVAIGLGEAEAATTGFSTAFVAGAGVATACWPGPQPMADRRVAVLATPPMMYITRRIMSRRLM